MIELKEEEREMTFKDELRLLEEEDLKSQPKHKWLHMIFWALADLVLIIPVIFLLWWFGNQIEAKKKEQEKEKQPVIENEESAFMEKYEIEGIIYDRV